MGKSQRLKLSQVRAVFRLVGEVAEHRPEWRAHYLTELIRMTGSQVAMGGDAKVAQGQVLIPGAIDLGWATDSDRRVYLAFMADGRCYQEPTGLITLANPNSIWTRSRRQLIPDREYHRSEGYFARREGHNGDYLHSCYPWPDDGVICMLQLNRSLGEPPFTPVELKLVHLAQAEVQRDREARRQRRQQLLAAGLSRRPRHVLELLLAGRSEKMAAAELGISAHTVHQYVKAVYEYFGVHSRGELLARWVRA